MTMHRDDTTGDDDPPADWLTRDDLLAAGYDEALIARLPVTHTGHDAQPCWHRDDLPGLLAHAAMEVRQ
jgi:hypothetical protein